MDTQSTAPSEEVNASDSPLSESDLALLRAREAILWRRYKWCAGIALALLAIVGLISTRTVQDLFPKNFPDWASASIFIGLLGGSFVFIIAAKIFLNQRNWVNRQLPREQKP